MRALSPQQEARRTARQFRLIRAAAEAEIRVSTPGNPVIHFRYDRLVATGEVNRQAWAQIVRDLWTEFTAPGKNPKKAPFARLLGVDPTTVDNWLDCAFDVKEASVRQVAERTGHNAMEWLIQVGYYSADELPRYSSTVIDEEQRRVLDRDDLDAEQQAYILRELEKMRATDEELLALQRERDRRNRDAQVDSLIERIRRTS